MLRAVGAYVAWYLLTCSPVHVLSSAGHQRRKLEMEAPTGSFWTGLESIVAGREPASHQVRAPHTTATLVGGPPQV